MCGGVGMGVRGYGGMRVCVSGERVWGCEGVHFPGLSHPSTLSPLHPRLGMHLQIRRHSVGIPPPVFGGVERLVGGGDQTFGGKVWSGNTACHANTQGDG